MAVLAQNISNYTYGTNISGPVCTVTVHRPSLNAHTANLLEPQHATLLDNLSATRNCSNSSKVTTSPYQLGKVGTRQSACILMFIQDSYGQPNSPKQALVNPLSPLSSTSSMAMQYWTQSCLMADPTSTTQRLMHFAMNMESDTSPPWLMHCGLTAL
jgi:hypothetical protein